MDLLENVTQFISDNRNLLNNYDFKAIYNNCVKLNNKEVGLMTSILLKARINPLHYINYVP